MNLSEITIYLSASKDFNIKKENLDKFLDFCNLNENFDIAGSNKPINYNGTPFDKDIFMSFDLDKNKLNKVWQKNHLHRNITLYNWQKDSPIKEIINVIEDINFEITKKQNFIDIISLLIGEHYNFTINNKKINQSSFSIAFLLHKSIDNTENLNIALRRDSEFCNQIAILNEYFNTTFSLNVGLS